MSNYVQTTFFAPKDSLTTGNPAKLIKGADVDPELFAIATAIATKYDSNFLASSNAWTGVQTFSTYTTVGNNIGGPNTSFTYSIGADPASTTTNGGFVQLSGSAASNSVVLGAGNRTALTVGSAGNIVVAAPSSGVPLTLNQVSGSGYALQMVAPAGNGAATVFSHNSGAQSWVLGGVSNDSDFQLYNLTGTRTVLDVTPAGNVIVSAPTGGNTLTLANVAGANGLVINSASTNNAVNEINVQRAGAGAANTLSAGSSINLGSSTSGTVLQSSGNQTEIWQYNSGWNQLAYWTATRGLVLNAPSSGSALTTNGGPVQSQPTGTAAAFYANGAGSGPAVFQAQAANAILGWGTGFLQTGTAAPALTANKPGSTSAVIGWMSVSNNGVQGWIPVFGN